MMILLKEDWEVEAGDLEVSSGFDTHFLSDSNCISSPGASAFSCTCPMKGLEKINFKSLPSSNSVISPYHAFDPFRILIVRFKIEA